MSAWRLAPLLFLAACDRVVDDGNWLFTWRLDGVELTSAMTQPFQTCVEGSHGVGLMFNVRMDKRFACQKLCTGLDPSRALEAALEEADDATQTCLLSCDAKIVFVSAHCEPTTHNEKTSFFRSSLETPLPTGRMRLSSASVDRPATEGL